MTLYKRANNQWTDTNRKVNTSYWITSETTFYRGYEYFSFSSRQPKWILFFVSEFVLARDTCFATLIGVVWKEIWMQKKYSSIGPQGIVIIKHSNISTERHVYINKWVPKKYIIQEQYSLYFVLLFIKASSFPFNREKPIIWFICKGYIVYFRVY